MACPESKDTSRERREGNFYAYYGNTAFDLDPLPVSHARLTVEELALFEWVVFEMAATIQSLAKCEVCSVIRLFNAKGERPAEIHKFRNSHPAISTCFFTWRNISLVKFRRRWLGARRCSNLVQSAGGTLLWLGDIEAGSKT